MAPGEAADGGLLPGARRLVELAQQKQQHGGRQHLHSAHWLLALLERHGAMVESMVDGLDATALAGQWQNQLAQGETGTPLACTEVLELARANAEARGQNRISERDIAAVILARCGYRPAQKDLLIVVEAMATPPGYRPRAHRPTPMLERFGRDLTREAQQGQLSAFVGREEEVQLVIETLCRRTKRNPLLVGPAGVGKTAIVEELAQRLVASQVPAVLVGARLFAVQPSTLVAGTSVVGELENRFKALLKEASQDGVLLFIDEVHSVVGAGGRTGTDDVASLLKPALARGEIACIAATTDDEFRRYIEPDAALERRFQPIRIQELNAEQTLVVLGALAGELGQLRGVQVGGAALSWLVDFAAQFLPNRRFPDKAIDLLEQCIAYAVARDKHAVELADAAAVARRMVGMPVAVTERLAALRRELPGRVALVEEDIQALVGRLNVTLRSLDLRPARPNAALLLVDRAAALGEALGGALAELLFGSAERVIAIDFGSFTSPADLSMLLGAPPGYVGYADTLPIHRLAQMPWCVLRCDNVHACHPQIRQVLAQALESGFFTDAHGKRAYLSDAVVLITAEVALASQRSLGFAGERPAADSESPGIIQSASAMLGAGFVDRCDLVFAAVAGADAAQQRWLRERLLAELSVRYRRQGLELHWDDSLVQWLAGQRTAQSGPRDWERLVDERLSPALIEHLPFGEQVRSLVVRFEAGTIRTDDYQPEERQRHDGI
ncbi:AAA family ATPase [Gloeobacter morelensis]|uniref:ATP-dependent Clp protease ATP-binding subunit n=1 Tax=Gloeobacter morelensis MG652769 TaxID=2781736 RepID=A0ABY3PNH3_9CYAN|nr:AAA family ATPase [Gloeobacter morelensis]UFP95164.1 ATP-dependent Clp protease ATP-binding subunit [Gloeobacter morelensis MG652769]